MKKYIGNILDFNGGIVRMLNSKGELTPHYLGGANQTGDITFLSYEENEINPEYLRKNDLRFLTQKEVAIFFRGENLKGEKLKKPEMPKFTKEQLKEYKKIMETMKKA